MKQHSLDKCLQSYCNEHPEYMNLYSTWSLNKTSCSEALKNVVVHYPHFSMHDSSHADTVLSKIEMLLGDRIQQLSPTDMWLILHAAYTHDLGMIVKWEEIEQVWSTSEFQEYLLSLSDNPDKELRDAANWVCNLNANEAKPFWPLKTYRYVKLLNAAFFRQQHAQLSRRYIDLSWGELKLDLGHSGLIKPRLLKVLSHVCELHTAPIQDIFSLDHETDGFGSDYAHPRFVAMLLRLGDLLDVYNDRFNTVSELVSGQLPESSVPHKEKHSATTHLLVTPAEIQFTSDCPNAQAYLEVRNFVDWLDSEIDFLTKYWVEIVPSTLSGFAPRFNKKELYIAGTPDVEGVAGLRFEISQEKAFQIIEGSNIYSDRFVFIREVLQNSMDASKLQFWRDLCSGTYHAWSSDIDLTCLQPYDIDPVIYKNYPIHVSLSTPSEGLTQVEVHDRGTGISIDSFKRMCNVGVSNSGSEKLLQEIREMPAWLRPTAGFGVGLQSIFLLTDKFEIETSTGLETFNAVVHSNRKGGYLQLQRGKQQPVRGTTIRMVFHTPKRFQYSMAGDTEKYLAYHFDPIMDENHMCEARILESIKTHCRKSMFPIQVQCSESSLTHLDITDAIPVCANDNSALQNWQKNGHYRYTLEADCSQIRIWDTEHSIYGEFGLSVPFSHSRLHLLFKGIEIDKHRLSFTYPCLRGILDVYGLDTKTTISLDRSSLTEDGSDQIKQILQNMINFYKNRVLDQLKSNNLDDIFTSSRFNLYAFWRACDQEQQARIPETLLKEHINEKATVLKRHSDGTYSKEQVELSTLIPFRTDMYFLNVEQFRTFYSGPAFDYERMISTLNGIPFPQIEEIIVEDDLIKAANAFWLNTVEFPVPRKHLRLYTVSSEAGKPLSVKGNTRCEIIRGLSKMIEGLEYSFSTDMPSKRYAIPAVEGYESLYLEDIPYGIIAPIQCKIYYIISPFDRNLSKMSSEMSQDAFVNKVLEAPSFSKLVSFVFDHTPQEKQRTCDEIIQAYRKLISEYYTCMHPNESV